jgi:hypothetical protein
MSSSLVRRTETASPGLTRDESALSEATGAWPSTAACASAAGALGGVEETLSDSKDDLACPGVSPLALPVEKIASSERR